MPTSHIKSTRHELLGKKHFTASSSQCLFSKVISHCEPLVARSQWKLSQSQYFTILFRFVMQIAKSPNQTANKWADVRFATACPELKTIGDVRTAPSSTAHNSRACRRAPIDQRCFVLPGELGTRKTWHKRPLAENSREAWPAAAGI